MPPGWTKTRARILRRDHWTCYLCGNPASEVDHVIKDGGEHDGNLAAICYPCHKVKSSAEGHEAKR